jgi:thioredoxin-like negative regulator of GroEL
MVRTPLLLLAVLTASSCDQAKDLMAKTKDLKAAVGSSSKATADIRNLTSSEYDSFIKTPGRLMVVQFHGDHCRYSMEGRKAMDVLAAEFAGKASVGIVDSNHEDAFASRERVDSVPSFRFYRDGRMVHVIDGVTPGQAEQMLRAEFSEFTKDIPGEKSAGKPAGDSADQPAASPAEPVIQPMKKDWLPPGIERR